jgi:hypothetical protein
MIKTEFELQKKYHEAHAALDMAILEQRISHQGLLDGDVNGSVKLIQDFRAKNRALRVALYHFLEAIKKMTGIEHSFEAHLEMTKNWPKCPDGGLDEAIRAGHTLEP